MPEQRSRFDWINPWATVAFISTLVILALLLVATITASVITLRSDDAAESIMPMVLGALSLIITAGWVVIAYGIVRVEVSNERAASISASRLGRIESLLESVCASNRTLIDMAGLSEKAKSLIYREHEIKALRESVHHDLMRQDYETAEALINAVEHQFGYVDEAQRLRDDVAAARRATQDEKIDAAVLRIDDIIVRHDWSRATREAKRLRQLFPDSPKIGSLPHRISSGRISHKRSLLQSYGEAVRKKDVDRSIELLHELDMYLTPQEAAALQESARGVFRAKLHQMGVQFAINVTDEDWPEAITIGQEIIRDYPNSRMAQEVRDKMDLLRTRAASTQPA